MESAPLENVIRIDDERVQGHLGMIVRGSVECTLEVPKLRRQTLEATITEQYRWRERSVSESLNVMYLAGASGRRVEVIAETSWDTLVGPGMVSNPHN